MNLIKSKKAGVGEATGLTLGHIITWILGGALIIFAFYYFYPYILDFMTKLASEFLK
ncbi:hypothetical protein HYY71_04275 [Candidatus Woesearchaeota archaeon]|nr:hypothetical protein [Candidatus Woesearchaeota archaeon]